MLKHSVQRSVTITRSSQIEDSYIKESPLILVSQESSHTNITSRRAIGHDIVKTQKIGFATLTQLPLHGKLQTMQLW